MPLSHASLPPKGAIRLTGPVVIEAAAEGSQGPRRFSGALYAGGPIKVKQYPIPIIVDLAGLEGTDKSRPYYRDHDESRIVGHMDSYQNDGKALTVGGVLSGIASEVDEVTRMADDKFPWQQSIEAMPVKGSVVNVPPGQKVTVNGRTFAGPVLVARRSKLIGASVVGRGADDSSTFTIAASAASSLSKEFVTMDFDKWVEALGLSLVDLTEKQNAALKAEFDSKQALIAASADKGGGTNTDTDLLPAFDADEIRASYSEHTASIEASFADFEGKIDTKPLADIRAKAVKAAGDLRRQAIREKWPAIKLENAFIKAAADVQVELIRAERPKGPAIHAGRGEVNAEVIEAALCLSTGLPTPEDHYSEQTLEAAHHRDLRNLGIQEVILLAAQHNGYSGRPRIHQGNLREVLACAFPIRGAADFSTVSLPDLLSNVANKYILMGFQGVETVWRQITEIAPVKDFKTMTHVRLLDDMAYEELGAQGEIAHGEVSEEKYTNQAKTYAKLFALTREMIINDDLGAFNTMRERIGRGAGIKFNRVFWKCFLDNAAFFTEARGNLITDVLGFAGIEAAELAFSMMTDGHGNPLDRAATMLLTGPALSPTAKSIYSSERLITGENATVGDANIYRNTYKPVKSDYITAAYGGSAAQWFLIGDPVGDMAIMEACFLDGVESPTVESAQADFDTLGVVFRGYHDFGVTKKEYRNAVKSTGVGSGQ